MLKYWFYGILATLFALVLSSGVTQAYARQVARRGDIPLPPQWEDMPGVAAYLYDAFYGEASDVATTSDAATTSGVATTSDAATDSLHYPIPQTEPYEPLPADKSLHFKNPVTEEVVYDPHTNEYVLTRKAGDLKLSHRSMSMEDYLQYDMDRAIKDYWKTKADYTPTTSSGLGGLIPGLNLNLDFLDNFLGKDFIKFDLNGSIGLDFAFVGTRRDDPSLDIKKRHTFNFDFSSDININLNATIADRIKFDISHNTEALFQFDNKFKLQYEGKEDEII